MFQIFYNYLYAHFDIYLFRVLLRYEAKPGSLVLSKDVYNHAEREMGEEIGVESVPTTLLGIAVCELFPREVKKIRVRRENSRVWAFSGLSLKNNGNNQHPVVEISYEEEWELLNSSRETILKQIAPSNWTTMCKGNTTSFLHLQELRYQKQLAVCEVSFQRNDLSKKIDIYLQYHERKVPDDKLNKILEAFKLCNLVDKVVNLLRFMERSYFCQGFEIGEEEDICGTFPLKRYKVSSFDGEVEDKQKAFSPSCLVLANSGKFKCNNCYCSTNSLKTKRVRKEKRLKAGKSQFSRGANHR